MRVFRLLVVLAATLLATAAAADAQVWTLTAPMHDARTGHVATRLNDGRVLVVGGYDGSNFLSSAELFDPTSNTWSALPAMSIARYQPTATLMPDGRVMIAGGWFGPTFFSLTNTTELFDPVTNEWSNGPTMVIARANHAATWLDDGRLLVTGGYTNGSDYSAYSATSETFDPSTNTWTQQGDMRAARVGHTASRLPDGRIVVAGGANYAQYEQTVDIFTPGTNTWEAAGNLSIQRYAQSGTTLPDGTVVVAGGYYFGGWLSSVEAFDPTTSQWFPLTGMPTPRSYASQVTTPDGRWMLIGGYAGPPHPAVDAFDPTSLTWTTLPSLQVARGVAAATLLADGRVLVMGGTTASGVTTSAELFGPPLPLVSVDPVSATYGGTTTISATLTIDGRPIDGRLLSFTLAGVGTWTQITAQDGRASLVGISVGSLAAGNYHSGLTVTWDGDALYPAAQGQGTVDIARAAPILTWPTPLPIVYGTALDLPQLSAHANVAGSLSYAPSFGTILSAGEHTLSVSFTPVDQLNYTDAAVNVSLTVTKAQAPVTWPSPSNIFSGTPLTSLQLNATSGITGSFVYAPPAGTLLPAGTHTLSTTFTPADTANYNATVATVSLTVLPSGRDLVVSAVTVSGSPVLPGGTLSVGDTVTNVGNSATGTSKTRFYLSLDGVKDGNDVLLGGNRPVPALAAGATSTAATPTVVTVPTSTALATYRVLACADDVGNIVETNESNNCLASANFVEITRPDLTVTILTNPPAAALPGVSFETTDTTTNVAALPTTRTATTRYFLSTDVVRNAGDKQLTGTRVTPVLEAGAASTGAVTLTIPSNTVLGTYFVIACADDTTVINESDETNNCRASTSTIQVTKPDLAVIDLSSPPPTVAKGGTFLVTDTVQNLSVLAAAATTTRYYLSVDASHLSGDGDKLLNGTRSLPALGAFESSTGSVSVKVPNNTASGLYFLIACADDAAPKVGESDETNNCRVAASTVTIP